jgi:hypothetical protein
MPSLIWPFFTRRTTKRWSHRLLAEQVATFFYCFAVVVLEELLESDEELLAVSSAAHPAAKTPAASSRDRAGSTRFTSGLPGG